MRITDLELLLQRFVAGPDRSIAKANELKVACDPFVDDEWFADLRIDFASYGADGGDHLLGDAEVVRRCTEALDEIARLRRERCVAAINTRPQGSAGKSGP